MYFRLSCLGLPKFVSRFNSTYHTDRHCKPYDGMQFSNQGKYRSVIPTPETPPICSVNITTPPNPYCEPNPFISFAYYEDDDGDSNTVPSKACMSTYQFLSNRNFKGKVSIEN